jgi:hypothetical protein
MGQVEDRRAQRCSVVRALCYLLDTVRPLTSEHFLHGTPGSRAYSACLAVISAALCWNQQRWQYCDWESADAAAWELMLGRVLPRLRDLQGTAHLLALGGVKDTQQQQQQQQQRQLPQQQKQQQPEPQQQGAHEQARSLAQEQGSQHRGQPDSRGSDRHTSRTTSQHAQRESDPAAAGSGGDVSQADVRSDVCPPADLALLMLMAAARTVKAGVSFHCFGMYCSSCDLWHPRPPVRDDRGSEQGDGGQGGSSSAAAGEHHLHKGQPSARCDGSSVESFSGQPEEQADRGAEDGHSIRPGLKDLGLLEEALDVLLTLVHCLVVRGAWWQQAISHHPLLLIQVLMTVADVSVGKGSGTICISILGKHGDSAACLPSHLTGLGPLFHACTAVNSPDLANPMLAGTL